MKHAPVLAKGCAVILILQLTNCGSSDGTQSRIGDRERNQAADIPTGAAQSSTSGSMGTSGGATNITSGSRGSAGKSGSSGAGIAYAPPLLSAGPSAEESLGAPAASGASAVVSASDVGPVAPAKLVGTNPFVYASHDPLSTFGADVDTASYDIFRRDVNLGVLPQPANIRLEEFVNSFSYDYPAPEPTDVHPFRISLAAAPHLLDRGTTLLRVGIRAKSAEAFVKKPTNLVFLVDTSGSMQSPDKLPLVQYTLTEALKVLAPTDVVSLVSYAGDVSVRLAPTPVSEHATIIAAIQGLSAGGSTNGAGGLQLAYEQAEKARIEGGINHVVLCTDGDFNVGVSSTNALVDLITAKRKTGITLTALGYGSDNLNDGMMEAVSNKGNGVYGVISNADQATTYVQQRLLSTLEHVAQDLKIQVEFNPELVYAYRLLGYEDRDIADVDFRNDVVDAGEVGAGHRVTALYEVVKKGGTVPRPSSGTLPPDDGALYTGLREVAPSDFVLVKVRYKHPGATETDPALEVSASLKPEAIALQLGAADLDMQWAVAVAGYAEILKKSPFADPLHLDIIGNIAGAQSVRDADRTEFLRLFNKARPMLP